MDINALRQALLPFENRATGAFVMPAASLQGDTWQSVRALLQGSLAAETLTLGGIVTWPPDRVADTIAYVGTGTLFPWSGSGEQATLAVTAWFTVDGEGNPQLRVQALPDMGGGWGLGVSLDGLSSTVLSGVRFDDGGFLLTSVHTTASGYPGTVPPGTSFSGTVSLEGPFRWMGGVLPSPVSRVVAGAVDLSRAAAPAFTLSAPFTRTVAVGTGEPDGGVQMGAGAELSAGFVAYADATDGSGWQVSRAAALAYVRTGSGAPVWLRLPVGADGTPLSMAMVGEPVQLAGWSDLTALAAGVSVDIVPAAVPQGPRLFLNGLEMGLRVGDGTAAPSRGFVSFDVSLDTGGWDILPNGILTVDELGTALTVNLDLAGTLAAVGSVYGTVTLAGVMPLRVALSIPTLEATMRLTDGQSVSVAALMEQFMTRLTGRAYRPPIDMTITQLDVAVSVPTGQFDVQGEILTEWSVSLGTTSSGGSLITLSFDGIQWFVGYDGRALSGTITAFTSITAGGQAAGGDGDPEDGGEPGEGTEVATTARFYVSATTTGGDDAGWLLSMGLTDESTLSVSALLEAFMYPGEEKPGGAFNVPTLVVSRLGLSMATDADNTPFAYTIGAAVEGSWDFQPLPGTGPTLQLSASFDLQATRPVDTTTKRVREDGEWSISGSVEGTFSIYGLRINAGYVFAPANSALTFGVWYGERGIQATVTRREVGSGVQARTETILTVRLGDLSLGEILDFLIGLAVPGEGRRLPSPWDVLYQVNFRNLSLQVNLDSYDVEVDYALNLNLGFATIEKIGLVYTSAGGEGSVMLQLTGDFLGQPYGTDGVGEPLGWDVIRDPAPSVPGKGTGLIDITYVGMGQHVALPVPDSQLRTVEQVIAALKASMGPPSGGGSPLGGPDTQGLRYDANSKWLFGVQATVMETLSFSAVFYDPHLYGALVEMFGPRAGPLAGLRFELLYRRITDDIGEFSVDLRVPDQFRQWEFGYVSVTLGIIHVDVYTNGNFRINAGFPTNGDFSVSFGVQWFPFIGQGGFYFAYLNGTTSERVPRITNGTFDPVIEAGVGLAVGVGKQIDRGPLKAGLALEVYAILEGIYAPFHPYDATLPRDTYYWFQGTAGIVGKLYGSVDFKIIKVSVSVVARAQALITIEAHQPTVVALALEVRAQASIKVLFVTIHFSFSLTLDASFTIGSRTSPPWVVGQPQQERLREARVLAVGAEPSTGDAAGTAMLRQQGAQARDRTMSGVDTARFHTSRSGVAGTPAKWEPVAVYGEGAWKTARFQFVPGFTIAGPSTLAYDAPVQQGDVNQLQVVLMLVAENTIDPGAVTAEEVAQGSTGHLHATDDAGTAAFPRMVETVFRWAAQAGAGVSGTETITAAQVASLLESLQDPEFIAATFDYDGNLQPFLEASLHFQVVNCPSDAAPADTSGTFMAMIPEIVASVSFDGGTPETRDYRVFNAPADPERYAENLAAYFEQLATDYLANSATDPLLDGARQSRVARSMEVPEDDVTPSMAELVFSEYFALLTRVAVQGAADLLAEYPCSYPQEDGPSLAQLAARFDVTPLSIARDNQGAALRTGTRFNAAGLAYQVRAAQTLDGIASAIPQQVAQADSGAGILGPLTGAAVGAANASLTGLLRPASTITIPSFTYTPVEGDTDTFLAAFWQVRNQGVTGIPGLDWYAQAISTLNPGGTIDWSAPTGTLVVPSAFQNTETTATYTVHGGDTLERIAGQLALWQAGPVGEDVGVITTEPMQHVVTSTDTFSSVAAIYPGLGPAELIGANVAADVLAPLTPVVLPGFGVSTAAGETLASLAQAFDLTLDGLVTLVRTTENLFAATAPASGGAPAVPPLVLRGVPGLPVDDVVTAITAPEVCNPMAAQVSRFLLHGLRVPSPADADFTALTPEQVLEGEFTGKLYGSFEMAGVQFPWPASGKPLSITLSTTADWVTLMEARTQSGGDRGTADAALLAASPALARGSAVVMATETATSISVTLQDEPPFDAWIPDTSLTLDAMAAVMPLADTGPKHYDLQASIHWQAADPPDLDGNTETEAPGEPSIWLFPDTLRTVARSGTPPTPAFALRGLSLDAPAGTEGTELAEYAWSVQVPFIVHRIPGTPVAGQSPAVDPMATGRDRWVDGSYVVEGADQAGEDLLYELWTYLADNPSTEAGTRLFLLYPPSAASSAPSGLASDQVGAGVVLLKTNLGTETRDPGPPVSRRAAEPAAPDEAARDEDEDRVVYSAELADFTLFVTYLWEATSVRAGGFYLRYDVNGRGIPDFVFDESGRGVLYLQCLLGSQTGTTPGRGLLPVNNCAVVLDNVDASATQVYAVQTGGTPPLVTMSTVPPGNVGYAITRTSPEPAAGEQPTPQQRTGLLYNLFGFAVGAGGGFVASNECLPAGPAPAPDGGGAWYYQQVIEASRLASAAGRISQHNAALPSPDADPYAGVSSTAAVGVEFAAHDAFGNQATPGDPLPALPIPFRYTDAVIGVGEWPGSAASYTVQPAGEGESAPSFVVSLALQSGNYVPAPGVETAVALQTASTHALRYQRVFYQLNRPGVGVTAATALAPAALTLSRARFAGFVNGVYVFTSQVAAMPPVRHTTAGGETLGAVATEYSVTVQDLLAANQNLEAAELFAGPAVVPVFDRVKHGETLNAFAARNQTTAAALLQTTVNLQAPVSGGVSLAVTPRTVPADATLTLSQMAAAQGCTVPDLANANQGATGLLADGVQWWVRGLSAVSGASTFDSLAADFATQGLQTTPGEIASANADLTGVFVASTESAPVGYTVDRWTNPQACTLSALIAARFDGKTDDFITLNGGTAGMIAQSTPLQLRVDSVTPPAGATVNGWAERVLRISVAQLAAANASGTGVPALADGVELVIPALLDVTPLSAVPYAIPEGTSLREVADLFGIAVDALGESIQDIPGIFNPGQSVSVGTMGPVTTDGEDSIATLLAKFTGPAVPTLDQLIDAIAPSTTLPRAGAGIVTPPAKVASGETTLAAAARRFGFTDATRVARANASMDGFLDPARSATIDGKPTAVGAHGTLTSLYRRVLLGGQVMEFDAFLDAIAVQELLREGALFLLPPPPATATAPLPADPAVTAAITELQATITVARRPDEVGDDFGAQSDVAYRTSPVAALTSGVPAGYTAFAQGVEDAYAGRLRVALGKPASATGPGRPRLYAVRFEAADGQDRSTPAVREVEVGNTPSFFSLPPLCTELISRTADIRVYQSGAEDPLPPATQATVFRAVDVQQWASGVLSAIDLVLSTGYGVPAFLVTRGQDGTSADFDRLVAAKKTLAEKVSGQLQEVVPAGDTSDLESAVGALRQTLDVSLSEGWNTAAVVQLPTTVDATWASTGLDTGGHRFAGKPLPPSLPMDTTSTLGGIGAWFHVHPAAIARVLGGTPNLLQPGVVLASPRDPDLTWTIAQHDTLQSGADTLEMPLDDFAVAFADQKPLFRDGASATVNGASAVTTAPDSLAGVADTLAAGVGFLSVANQSVAGLLTGTVYVHGVAYDITGATSSLAGLASAAGMTVEDLGEAIAGQAVLVGGITLYVAQLLPDYSLSAGRIDLDRASGNLNLLLQLADPAWYRRLLVNVDFQLTGFEYGVQDAPLTDDYQTSDWLHFVTALTGEGVVNPATLDTVIGQVDIPVPLRAYPTPPLLAGQYATATYPDLPSDPSDVTERMREAKAWTYRAAFQTQEAAQDVVWLRLGANFAPVPRRARLMATLDPFTALAEWAANDPAIQADLRNLLLPPAALAAAEEMRRKAKSAVVALGRIAETVAGVWGPIAPDAVPDPEEEAIAPEQEWVFTLETRTRSSSSGTPLIDALVLTRDPLSTTAGWGPEGRVPVLGYVADDGDLRLLEGEPVGGHGDQLRYAIDDDVEAFTTRTFVIQYSELDAVATQNARTSLWITRNDRLVPGRETNHAFVYRTPETHFADLASPAIVRSAPISIGSGSVDGLTAAVSRAFTQLLGSPPEAARSTEKLTVRFGVQLVPPSGGEEGISMLTPVVFRPLFAYTDAVPAQVTGAFKAWLDAGNLPPPGVTAFVSLEVMVFSGILPDRQLPLLDILRLDYGVTFTGAEGGEVTEG